MTVHNYVVARDAVLPAQPGGLGLHNLRRRLQLLYPGRHVLTVRTLPGEYAVTLELTPKDAEMLDLARSVGTLSLVLRNQTDPKVAAQGGGATKAELLGMAAPAPAVPPALPAAPAPKPVRRTAPRPAAVEAVAMVARSCVEVIRGVNKVTECF